MGIVYVPEWKFISIELPLNLNGFLFLHFSWNKMIIIFISLVSVCFNEEEAKKNEKKENRRART